MVHCSPTFKGIAHCVDDLLTTRQLQDLLQVDRITIYRMLSDGRLQGFKVGGQWRFSRQAIEAWLAEHRAGLEMVEGHSLVGDDPLPTSQVLPLSCVQAIQGVYAEALGIAAVTVDLGGEQLTEISNSCEYCTLILSTEEGQRRCEVAWKSPGNGLAHVCHAGLLCVSAPITIGEQTLAITAGCQFSVQAPNGSEPAWQGSIPNLAADLGLIEGELRAAAKGIRLVPRERPTHISHLLHRVAETFSEIGQERLSLLNRLQHIAEMSKI
jgi:excisionase family DNA binding protein